MTVDLLARVIDLKVNEHLRNISEQSRKLTAEMTLLRDFFTPIPISDVIYKVINGRKVGYRDYGIWQEKRGGGYDVTYEHTETYAGTTTTLNLDFSTQVMLKRIEMIWDDTITKDYEIRMFSDFNHSSLYSLLKKETGNTETSDITFLDFVYPAGSRLQFYFSNYTAAKINKILIVIEEL